MSRASRRHHAQRIKARARRIGRLYSDEFIDMIDQFIRKSDHLKSCSCRMCGNPRKLHDERTRQELLANLPSVDLQ